MLGARVSRRLDAAAKRLRARGRPHVRRSARCCSRPAPTRCAWPFRARPTSHVHYLRTLRRQPRDRRQRAADRQARRGRRRELHRPRGGRVAARARHRRPRRRAREPCRSSASWAPRSGASSGRCTRRTASCFTWAQTVSRIDGRAVTLSDGHDASTPTSSSWASACGRRSALAEQAGLADRPRHRRQRVPRDQRARHLRRGRHRALARPAHRRADPRRALGRRRAPGPDRRAQHARPARALRRRAVLLEPALRRRRSTTSATPRSGTPSRSTAPSTRATATVTYQRGGRTLAVATVYRDRASLEAERDLERSS